jgi:hypothetical protein
MCDLLTKGKYAAIAAKLDFRQDLSLMAYSRVAADPLPWT